MSKLRLIFLAVILFTTLGACAKEEPPAPTEPYYDIYVYPVYSGSDEWKALSDKGERMAACQLPEEYLRTAKTADLLATVLDYPYLIDIDAYPDKGLGLDVAVHSFNGLAELMQREDLKETIQHFEIDKLYLRGPGSRLPKGSVELKLKQFLTYYENGYTPSKPYIESQP